MTSTPTSVETREHQSLQGRIRKLRDGLSAHLVERDEAARLALLAALAGEHLLLLGPPGTSKSLVARRLHHAFSEATYFERLLTRFTVPEELFGPLSIKGLEEDRYERLTASYLPSASVAFLDEIFKANSAILNALLTLLNEREFDNGVRREKVPLIAVVGASNEMPEGGELDALFDRFLVRLHVGPVSKESFKHLLSLRGELKAEVTPDVQLTRDEALEIQARSASVVIPDDVTKLLCDLREWCAAEKIAVSDRRWRKIVKLLQVSAFTNGRETVSIWDCWLLQHCLWETPDQKEILYKWYADRVGASAAMNPEDLTRLVVQYEVQLKFDQESRSQRLDESGRPLYLDLQGNQTLSTEGIAQKKRDRELLYVAPEGATHPYICEGNPDCTNDGKGFTVQELDRSELPIEGDSGRRKSWVVVHRIESKLPIEGDSGRRKSRQMVQFAQWPGRLKYLADPGNAFGDRVKLQPLNEPTKHIRVYVSSRVSDLKMLETEISDYRQHLEQHITSLKQEIDTHLWVDPAFADPTAINLFQTRETVIKLHSRVESLVTGFRSLPVEPDRVGSPAK